jgi:hypothetical protein
MLKVLARAEADSAVRTATRLDSGQNYFKRQLWVDGCSARVPVKTLRAAFTFTQALQTKTRPSIYEREKALYLSRAFIFRFWRRRRLGFAAFAVAGIKDVRGTKNPLVEWRADDY